MHALIYSQMKTNYLKLKKAFMTFDRHLDGYVSIDDLKNILNSFTLPMSEQLFVQLMDRLVHPVCLPAHPACLTIYLFACLPAYLFGCVSAFPPSCRYICS